MLAALASGAAAGFYGEYVIVTLLPTAWLAGVIGGAACAAAAACIV